jgi:hypothetical protein
MKTHHGAVAMIAALILVGCDDAGTTLDADLGDLDLAVATVAAEATLDDVESMTIESVGLLAPGLAGIQGPQGKLAPGDDLERSRVVTFYDEGGAVMDEFDPLLTERVEIDVDIEGSLERPMWTGQVERHRDIIVSGLLGDETERTWNGTGSDEHSAVRVLDEGDMERSFEGQATIEDVVVAVPRSENPWPISGTITRHVEVTVVNGPQGDLTRERTVVVTFDGTQYPTMTVNGEEFEIDLADRQGHRPRRRGPGGPN